MTTMSAHAGSTKGQSSNHLPRKAYSVIGRKKPPPSDCGSTNSRKSLSTMSRSTRERTVKKLRLAKALTIPDGTTVLDACRRMVIRRVDAALLTDSSALLCGIITDKDVTTRVIAEGLKPEETLVSKVMTRNPLFVMSDTSAVEALQKMVQGKFRHLPVVEDGEVTGLLDITRCLYDAISGMERAAEKGNAIAAAVEGVERQWGNTELGSINLVETLREKMFRPSLGSLIEEGSKVAIVLPTDTVFTAAKKMRDLQVSSAVVSTNNKPQGILTSKDILMRVVRNNLQPNTTTVEQVMTPSPECVTVDTSIVDALHTMHDGKFLHLPVVDQDGFIVACLDVLQLTQAAIAVVGADTGGTVDMTSTVLQRFWDSALLLEPPVDDDDRHSDGSMTKSYAEPHEPDQIKHPSIGPFAFKIEDAGGRVHRFQSGMESLTELKASISQRVGIDVTQLPGITYEDEEGDHVILETDSDLSIAVNHAKMSGWKVLKLHLDFNSSRPRPEFQPIYKDVKNRVTKEDCSTIQKKWIPTPYSNVMVAAVVATSIGVVIYWRRSNS